MTSLPVAEWRHWLERRVMRLLLRHDESLFRGRFRHFYATSALPPLDIFREYDRWLRLRTLVGELLDDIVARIRRQVSLQTSTLRQIEAYPTRGMVEWHRTLERQWRTAPTEPPLDFNTRLRLRSADTPENIFLVAVLLEVGQQLHHSSATFAADGPLTEGERAWLSRAEQRIGQIVNAPDWQMLHGKANAPTPDALAARVAQSLRPGPTPYRALLHWWDQYRALKVGRDTAERTFTLTTPRDDEKREAWLYELWLVLEWLDALHNRQAIEAGRAETDMLQFTFSWAGHSFYFRYNRQWDGVEGEVLQGWEHGPGSRPDYTISRAAPLVIEDRSKSPAALIWQEPPFVLDAKYYLRGNDPARTHPPLKKLLGDLLLLRAERGILFFPDLPEPVEADSPITRVVRRLPTEHGGVMPIAPTVELVHIAPDMGQEEVQARLLAVTAQVVVALPERPTPRCEGVWLDSASHNSTGTVPLGRILCPKAHIGAGVVDIVSPDDCLKNARLCHVMGQAVVPPFVLRAHSAEEVEAQSQRLRHQSDATLKALEAAEDEDAAEAIREPILNGVGQMVGQYVEITKPDTRSIENKFKEWVFGQYWEKDGRALNSDVRHMLISGEYVWEQLTDATVEDWAPPAIQYCRALEHELRRRLEVPMKGAWTIGSPHYIYRNRKHGETHKRTDKEWLLLTQRATQSSCSEADLIKFIERVESEIRHYRNDLAHGDPVPHATANALRVSVLGQTGTPGMLYWLVKNIKPLR